MAEGLRFECQPGCTECCRQQGFVYLSEADIVRIAAFCGHDERGRVFLYPGLPVWMLKYGAKWHDASSVAARARREGGVSFSATLSNG